MAHLFAPSKALGFVQSGQSVRLRYEPYPYQTYGMHEGIVLEVSNSPLRPEDFAILSTTIKQEGMYRVTVKIKSQIITKNGKQTTLFPGIALEADIQQDKRRLIDWILDRKSTRLNSSHSQISYAVFCLKKKNRTNRTRQTEHARQD